MPGGKRDAEATTRAGGAKSWIRKQVFDVSLFLHGLATIHIWQIPNISGNWRRCRTRPAKRYCTVGGMFTRAPSLMNGTITLTPAGSSKCRKGGRCGGGGRVGMLRPPACSGAHFLVLQKRDF